MISQQTIDIVKSTAPILAEHGETLTRHFYKRMFSHNPEVLPFFNPANQSEGTQQRALAGAICAYAANIDNLEVLGNAVELIAQKHASLQVRAEHYPIVGENLLSSIREVLGEGATDEIINAWGEAYGFLADILIGRESEIYDDNAQKPGGWEGFRPFKVVRKDPESDVITSFYLKPEDDGALPSFKAGQYITVRMPMGDITTMRNYSLSDVPNGEYLRISVKKEMGTSSECPHGYVSHILHNDIEEGAVLEIGAPCGEFFFDPAADVQRPVVLLAGGVGITPIFSMLKSMLQANPQHDITFIHACLNRKVQPFKTQIDALAAQYPNLKIYYRYNEEQDDKISDIENASAGFVDQEFMEQAVLNRDAEYYFCGPKPFMAGVNQVLRNWDIEGDQIHFEFFGPLEDLEKAAEPDQKSAA